MSSYALTATPPHDHLHHVTNGANSIANSGGNGNFYYPFAPSFDKLHHAYQQANLLGYSGKPSFSVTHLLDIKKNSCSLNDDPDDEEGEESDDNIDSKPCMMNISGQGNPGNIQNPHMFSGMETGNSLSMGQNLHHYHNNNNNNNNNSSYPDMGSQSPRDHTGMPKVTPPSPRGGRTPEETPNMLIHTEKFLPGVSRGDMSGHDDNNNGNFVDTGFMTTFLTSFMRKFLINSLVDS
ncbi:hybrid signal transduction histidine kinase D-like [Physella acuta]|uniref:hybrid signal transduction histidine kinase D-like n=1 Tax=Physella acuta TaxID=109671 RepID=UPI0027DDF16E|nr:hybrid signal transduction histidine kinase D-like [Physella acuta]